MRAELNCTAGSGGGERTKMLPLRSRNVIKVMSATRPSPEGRGTRSRWVQSGNWQRSPASRELWLHDPRHVILVADQLRWYMISFQMRR